MAGTYRIGQLRKAYQAGGIDPATGFQYLTPIDPSGYSDVHLEEIDNDDPLAEDTGSVFADSVIDFYNGYELKVGTYYYFRFRVRQLGTTQNFSVRLISTGSESEISQEIERYTLSGGAGSKVYELILAPENSINRIKFYLTRILDDYQSQRNMKISILDLSEINNMIPNEITSLTKIGIQTQPGSLLCVNGAQIRVGRSGIYEINNGVNITFFGIAHGEELSTSNNGLSDGATAKRTTPSTFDGNFIKDNLKVVLEKTVSNVRNNGPGFANKVIGNIVGSDDELSDNAVAAALNKITSNMGNLTTNCCISIQSCMDDNYKNNKICLAKISFFTKLTANVTFVFIYRALRSLIEPASEQYLTNTTLYLYLDASGNWSIETGSLSLYDYIPIEFGAGNNIYVNNLGLFDIEDDDDIDDHTGRDTAPFIFDYSWDE